MGSPRAKTAPPLVPVGHADAIDGDVLAVRSALAGLPEGQRQALVLRHYLGLREREISEAMGCPIGTVRSHLRRGLHTMRKAMT